VHENFGGKDGLRSIQGVGSLILKEDVTIMEPRWDSFRLGLHPKSSSAQDYRTWPGAYIEGLELNGDHRRHHGWFGWDTALEIIGLQTSPGKDRSLSRQKRSRGDLMSVVIHVPDGINHLVIG